jgi:uncharacterized membrane protein YfcA
MGYGTLMSPILLIIGYPLQVVVPVLLLAQLFVGASSSAFHHTFKNANFHPKEKDIKRVLIFTTFGVFGMFIGIFLVLSIPNFYIVIYIGLMIIAIGIIFLAKIRFTLSKKNLYWIGAISAFNKAVSGGGFGPIVTLGQMTTGSEVKKAIAITTLSETLISVFGFVIYLIFIGHINLMLSFIIIVAGVLASPIGVVHTKKLKEETARIIIGIVIIVLGVITLGNCFF